MTGKTIDARQRKREEISLRKRAITRWLDDSPDMFMSYFGWVTNWQWLELNANWIGRHVDVEQIGDTRAIVTTQEDT